MDSLFNVIKLNYKDKNGILVTEAHSQVKSKKYFPIYVYNNKKMIFKPLSKTKPLTTPLFAYSEVYWSYIINKYFEPNFIKWFIFSIFNFETIIKPTNMTVAITIVLDCGNIYAIIASIIPKE